MPTALRVRGYRFFFYAEEGNEPMHVHIQKGDGVAKVWIDPLIEAHYFYNFKTSEQREIIELAKSNHEILRKKWNEFFKNK